MAVRGFHVRTDRGESACFLDFYQIECSRSVRGADVSKKHPRYTINNGGCFRFGGERSVSDSESWSDSGEDGAPGADFVAVLGRICPRSRLGLLGSGQTRMTTPA